VLSRSTASRDRGAKRERYAHYGVAEYWMLDPRKRRVEVRRCGDDAAAASVLATGTLDWQPVPGGPTLAIDIRALFRDLD